MNGMYLAKAVDGGIQITLSKEAFITAAEGCPLLFLMADKDTPAVKIIDHEVFLKEIVDELNSEDEFGNNLVTRMFDNALLQAVDYGCEGHDGDWDPNEIEV